MRSCILGLRTPYYVRGHPNHNHHSATHYHMPNKHTHKQQKYNML